MIGDEKYKSVVSLMENFSNSTLKSNLDCIRPGLINHDENGNVLMVPVFSRTYGMLVNNDLFNKEKIDVPSTWDGLIDACNKLKENGHKSPMMGYSLTSSSSLMNTIAYPLFVSELAKNEEALSLANSLDSRAGVYMKGALEKVDSLIKNGCIDLDSCDEIKDNYEKVLLRFFEGDVPMMICTGDTVSGTKKREEKSEAFTKSPFNYSFSPIPLTNEGGYFIDSPSIEFSVNKDCDNLDMTNEFMKFLISNKELNEMAKIKRLTTPTRKMSFDSVYAPFAKISSDRIFYPEALGIKDQLTVQTRIASFKVGRGELTVSEAVSMYGSFA
jgi:multiple sugar transport system substrate-binding protein